MRRKIAIGAAFVAGSVITGTVGWSGHALALPVSVAFPGLWAFSPSRVVAALVAAGYFLGASRGLPVGASIFFGEQLLFGIAVWLAASIFFVAIHAVFWTAKAGWHRPLRYAIAMILMSLPPLGITGWASPITAAGILFPGWGWLGLAAAAAGLLLMTTRILPIAALVLAGFHVWSAVSWAPPVVPEGWVEINTEFKVTEAGGFANYVQHLETIALVKDAAAHGAKAVVLPESALGVWSRTRERLWRQELDGFDVNVIGGAALVDPVGYDNAMVEISAIGSRILYKERMPVPVSMWQPWRTGGARAHFFANPLVHFAGLRVAPLICYEQLIVWPVLQSMLHRPEVIIAIINGWWTGGTNIVAIQRASARAWASLFGLPLVLAVNV
ncbi:MAG: conjugal transfer protein TraB [Pseudorhizobium sp.]